MKIEKLTNITRDQFVENYLEKEIPVIVADAMKGWTLDNYLLPSILEKTYGHLRVPVCAEMFDVIGETTLGDFISNNFQVQNRSDQILPYLRWFVRSSSKDSHLYADCFFRVLENAWSMPYFLPMSDYLFPFCPPNIEISPNSSYFPAQGLFLSPKGARTRLHYDGWNSDAVLCQIYGTKHVTIFKPDQARFLVNANSQSYTNFFVDLRNYDPQEFPLVNKAEPIASFELGPGEILYIPKFYLHEIITQSDSISITWNFIHRMHLNSLLQLLTNRPWRWEIDSMKYVWFKSRSALMNLPFMPPEKCYKQ